MKHTLKWQILAAILITNGSLAGVANAAAILSAASGTGGTLFPTTMGFEFNTTIDFLVTHLSFYDTAGDGLSETHDIGLWNSLGLLLSQATVSAGKSSPLSEGIWRLVDVPDFVLPAAIGYVVGATFVAGTHDGYFEGTPTTIPGVTWVHGRYTDDDESSLTFPPNSLSEGLGGGSIEVSPVPEPSSALFLGLGLSAFVVCRRSKYGEQGAA